ncbi:MAG: alpha/beta hydrolase [Planctomycetota bacterium]
MRFNALFCVLILVVNRGAYAQEEISLYPNRVPNALGTDAHDVPCLYSYRLSSTGKRPAVMICPGGGYGHLAMDHEGKQIAKWFNSLGIDAFILKYRLGKHGYRHPVMFNDAQRGLRLIRSQSERWEIDPEKIGVMGFSAGGHLASTLATHFELGDQLAEDPVEQVSGRPDFLVLGYPVISMDEYTHWGSRRNLLGANASQALIKELSNHQQIKENSPPTFLFHTDQDKAVPAENSVLFYLGLRKKGIPAELHIYERGSHGVGFAKNNPVLSSWKDRLRDWLKIRGLIDPDSNDGKQ